MDILIKNLDEVFESIDESKAYVKGKFFPGGKSFIDFAIDKGAVSKLEDVCVMFRADFTNMTYDFMKESSDSNRVFITDTKTEKRIWITVLDDNGLEIKPDDNGFYYLRELWTNDRLYFKVIFEIEKNFTSTYSEEATFQSFRPIVYSSTEV